MKDLTFIGSHMKEYTKRFGIWVEGRKCRALMYDSFGNCWSCGTEMTDRNKLPVEL